MKKIILFALPLLLLCACKDKKVEKDPVEITLIDSLNKIEDQKIKADEETLQDSILQKQIDEEYKNGLSLSTDNIKSVNAEGTNNHLTFTFSVANNTSVAWEASDYQITFQVSEEYQTEDGDLDAKWFTKKANGKRVEPGETVTIIHENSGWYPKNIKIKKRLSKEKFAERFKEQTTYDKTLNKFIPKD